MCVCLCVSVQTNTKLCFHNGLSAAKRRLDAETQTSSCRVMVVCRCSSMASSSEIFSWRLLSEDVWPLRISVWMVVIWVFWGVGGAQETQCYLHEPTENRLAVTTLTLRLAGMSPDATVNLKYTAGLTGMLAVKLHTAPSLRVPSGQLCLRQSLVSQQWWHFSPAASGSPGPSPASWRSAAPCNGGTAPPS